MQEWMVRIYEALSSKEPLLGVIDDKKSYFFRKVTLHMLLLPVYVQSREQEKHFLWSCIF